jgi:hypothetical protein
MGALLAGDIVFLRRYRHFSKMDFWVKEWENKDTNI